MVILSDSKRDGDSEMVSEQLEEEKKEIVEEEDKQAESSDQDKNVTEQVESNNLEEPLVEKLIIAANPDFDQIC